MVRGVRGATTVTKNEEAEILQSTQELLERVVSDNELVPEDIASILISVTQELNATFPAKAVRKLQGSGWEYVPVMCALEIPVPSGLKNCIRLLLHVNTDKNQKDIKHVYLNDAVSLRPDLVQVRKN